MTLLNLQDYSIYLGDLRQALASFLEERTFSKLLVLVDENTERHCLPRLEPVLEPYPHDRIVVPAGEIHKNLQTCQRIWSAMMSRQLDRQSVVLNLGGGVMGDMGGFCAATFKRGLRFAQIPTTVLAQVDASIGGKLGIDFGDVKNSIGLFRNPAAVFIDTAFLDTLPARELRSGLAEIIKHSLIADSGQWRALRGLSGVEDADWPSLIGPSLRIKEAIVRADPLERGPRKSLNFGHTVGHAVEAQALRSDHPLLHGEAIAVGMQAEAWLSHRWLGLPAAALAEISESLLRIYGHRPLDPSHFEEMMALMRNDKKNTARGINFSLLPEIGKYRVDCFGPDADIVRALQYYNDLPAR